MKTVPSVMIFGLRILPRATLNIVAALISGCASMMIYAGVSGICPAAGISVQLKKLSENTKKQQNYWKCSANNKLFLM